MELMKSLPSEEDKSSDANEGPNGGNNSDNSALVSIGNTSFGFNFDSEEGTMNNSEGDSDASRKHNGGEPRARNAEKNTRAPSRRMYSKAVSTASSLGASERDFGNANVVTGNSSSDNAGTVDSHATDSVAKTPADSNANNASAQSVAHQHAAAQAVAHLQSIAAATDAHNEGLNVKRKREEDNDSGGYNSDDEDGRRSKHSGTRHNHVNSDATHTTPAASSNATAVTQTTAGSSSKKSDSGSVGSNGNKKKKNKIDDYKREERNAREKERSFRISKQINELRNLLSSGGVIVPKGTKSSVLTEAANYIRMLQQHQYRSEIDRHQLVQQIQMIGGGALGQQAATAVRHVAAQNGVWSLGNFGGVPPKTAMMYHQPSTVGSAAVNATAPTQQQVSPPADASVLPSTIETHDYRYVFNSCTVGLAIASMGGAFIDCNRLFCHLSNYTKQEICSMTIFNMTARQDLQHAFDLISKMLSATEEATSGTSSSRQCLLRGAMKNRDDLGLSVASIKGEDGVAKCFCVTLIHNPKSPFDTTEAIPATADMIQLQDNVTQTHQQLKDSMQGTMDSPAFTAG